MVLLHHEFFDGSGYPEAVTGEKIPLGARSIAVADAYDTITSDRTYKKARTATDALAELERCANAQFDGAIVKLFDNFDDGVRQRAHGVDEEFYDGSVKLRIRATLQLGESVCRSSGLLIRTVAGDRIVGVGDGNDASTQGDFLPGQCLWIARTIEEFVVVQYHIADARERREGVEDLRAKLHV